ncbi:Zinc carboxypeptidase [Helicosporidium sp. ATCC 50920]|nr:Zinc carboxypeptidase [Helicosporidium sp. ATCC 50920]|eukprot:KDD75729.1 Zinc carboxypeptidase [Helicosporidium sp. ATCC 50920]
MRLCTFARALAIIAVLLAVPQAYGVQPSRDAGRSSLAAEAEPSRRVARERQLKELDPVSTQDKDSAAELKHPSDDSPYLRNVTSRYLSNKELDAHLLDFVSRCGDIAELEQIGKSVEGRPIWALALGTKAVRSPRSDAPAFKYVSNIHGDEPLGRVFTLAMAEHLCWIWKNRARGSGRQRRRLEEVGLPDAEGSGRFEQAGEPRKSSSTSDSRPGSRAVKEEDGVLVTNVLKKYTKADFENMYDNAPELALLTKVRLYMVPSLNPDGFERRQRGNAAQKDLNRDFPDRWADGGSMRDTGKEQPETVAMMRWTESIDFVASAVVHGGALVANYPWDGTHDKATRYDACPDDAGFHYLASAYAQWHATMAGPSNKEFPDGTTNGAAWYPIYGSMQDWNYVKQGCMELTLELSMIKWPEEKHLAELWALNRQAWVKYPQLATLGGLSGVVQGKTSRKGGRLVPVRATVQTIDKVSEVFSSADTGVFFKPLAPGTHYVEIVARGYKPWLGDVFVPRNGTGARLNIVLRLLDPHNLRSVDPDAQRWVPLQSTNLVLGVAGVAVIMALIERRRRVRATVNGGA